MDGCTDSTRTFIGSKEGVTAVARVTPSGCEDDKGIIEITARNGREPFKYQLGENGTYTNSPVFENLPAGSYSLWVSDADDCNIGVYVDVPSGVSFQDEVSELVVANCATDACHGGSQSPELNSYDNISDAGDDILEVLNGHADDFLSEEEVRQIKCWIEDGTPNN